MEIVIRRLTSELAEDYVHFFDVTPHDDRTEKAELPCYCVTWRSDSSYIGNGDHWYPTREERRERALGFVRSGSLQGYLAYRGEEVVGWCNANAECQGCLNYLSSFWPIDMNNEGTKVKSVFCFVIAPQMQRQGIASMLLERVCADAAAEGYDFVEAYASETHTEYDFRGPVAMYEKCGFVRCAEKDGRVVVRKALS